MAEYKFEREILVRDLNEVATGHDETVTAVDLILDHKKGKKPQVFVSARVTLSSVTTGKETKLKLRGVKDLTNLRADSILQLNDLITTLKSGRDAIASMVPLTEAFQIINVKGSRSVPEAERVSVVGDGLRFDIEAQDKRDPRLAHVVIVRPLDSNKAYFYVDAATRKGKILFEKEDGKGELFVVADMSALQGAALPPKLHNVNLPTFRDKLMSSIR